MKNAAHLPVWFDTDWDKEFVPPEPQWVSVTGSAPLFFPGEVHLIYCRPGRGKTWLGMYSALSLALQGERSLYIDFENTMPLATHRLKLLGASLSDSESIAYMKTYDSLSGLAGEDIVEWVRVNEVKFVVIDSVARALAAAGLDENSNSEVNVFFAGLEKLREMGASVLLLDHVGHKSDGVDLPSPRGASAKVDQVAVAYYFDQVEAWKANQSGFAHLVTKKCRFGVRAEGDVAAKMTVDVVPGRVHVRMTLPSAPLYSGVTNDRAAEALVALLDENDGTFAGIAEAAITVAERIDAKREEVEAVISQMVRHRHMNKVHKNGEKAVLRLPSVA